LESAPSLPPYINLFRSCLSTIIVIPKSSGWTPRSNNGRALQVEKKHTRVLGCSVPDITKQKSAFYETWLCQKNVYKYNGENGSSQK